MLAAPFLKATFSYLHAHGHKKPQDMRYASHLLDSRAGLAPMPSRAPHLCPSRQSAQHKHMSGYHITYLVRCDKAGGNLIENNTAVRIKRRSPFSC